MSQVFSPQEERIIKNHGKVVFNNENSRIKRIYDNFKNSASAVDIQRARYFTESFKETEGEPLNLRWAKALHRIAEKIDVIIDDGQLLAGRGGRSGKYGIIYPELDGCFLNLFLNQAKTRKESPFEFSEEDAAVLANDIYPYWKDRTYYTEFADSLPEDILKLTFEPSDKFTSRYIINETSSMRSALQWVHDYKKGLETGFQKIKDDAKAKIDELRAKGGSGDKLAFWRATAIAADAIIVFAQRYSDEAKRLAQQEENSVRRAELLEIARICAKVPRYPADSFYEAVQSQWFMQLFSRLEQKTGSTISNGRMDQYLYPYYLKDKRLGRIDRERAKELLDCLWLAMAQYVDLYISPAGVKFNEGYAHWEAVTIGGVDENGNDAVNELTHIFLEDKREFPLNFPDLAARVHKDSPESYLQDVALTIKEGSGFPKLINDEEIIPILTGKGADLHSARDYAVSGCTEVRMPKLDTYTSPCPYINLGSAVELALNNGRLPRTGDELLTLETGRAEDFTSWEEFEQAFFRQERFLLQAAFRQQSYVNKIRAHHFAAPFGSSLHPLCLADAKDLHSEKIKGGIDLGYFDLIGYASAADSLAAVKKNVFDKHYFTMAELKAALDADFAGAEPLRQRLLNAPKYGNDDEYVDSIAKQIDEVAAHEAKQNYEKTGIYMDLRYVPVTSHIPFGKVTGALPNGRRAGTALSDGSSPSQGADVKGPTSVIMSNYRTKNYDIVNRAARLLNIKLNPATVESPEGTQKLEAFIRAWCALRLWHLQFNIINKQTLQAAQRHPEDYRSLLVRVAGYSAYFVELTKELQEDIISRTEHRAV